MGSDWDTFIKNLHGGQLRKAEPASQGAQATPGSPPKAGPPPTKRVATDVHRRIRDKAKVISVDKLSSGGTQFVRVLDPKTLLAILAEAMGAALENHLFLDEDERKQVEGAAQKEFAQLLADHRQIQEAKTEADRQRMKLERELERLRRGVDAQDARIAKERERRERLVSGDALRFPPEAFEEMERRTRGLIQHMLDLGELKHSGSPEDLAPFADALRETVGRVVQGELQKHIDHEDSQRDEAIDLLERRIAKLSRALEETQGVLQFLATQGAEQGGFGDYTAAVSRAPEPLRPESPHSGWRKNVLKHMFEENAELQAEDSSE